MKILKNTLRILTVILSLGMIFWYFISSIINIGSILGTVFFACVGAAAIFWDKISSLTQKWRKKRSARILLEIAAALVAVVVLYLAVVVVLMVHSANRAPKKDSTVVVLGCQVRGTTPSRMLKERINAAYSYLSEHPNAKCVVSGGKGANEEISEAQCMYNELAKMGIDKARIYMEEKSTNTYENIKFSEEVIAENGLNSDIAIVTDGFHEMRSAIITQKLGYSCGAVPSSTPLYLLGNFATREILAVTAEIVLN